MDLRSVECFVRVADLLHFGRAAAELHLSQPALSGRIRTLEKEMGVSLLQRDRRSVALSEGGAAFLPRARDLVARSVTATTLARRAARGESGTLRLGFTVIAFYTALPRVVQRFRSRYPDVRVELKEMNSPAVEEALAGDVIDLGILHPPVSAAALTTLDLPAEPLVLAVPLDHPLAGRAALTFAEVADVPLLVAPRWVGPAAYDRLAACFAAVNVHPRIVQEVFPMTTLVGLVSAGAGVGFVTRGVARATRPGVRFLPVPGAPSLPLAAAWTNPSPTAPGQRFLEVTGTVMLSRSPRS